MARALAGLAAAERVRNGHLFSGLLVGGGLEVVMVFVAILLVGLMFLPGSGCQRPMG